MGRDEDHPNYVALRNREIKTAAAGPSFPWHPITFQINGHWLESWPAKTMLNRFCATGRDLIWALKQKSGTYSPAVDLPLRRTGKGPAYVRKLPNPKTEESRNRRP